MTEYAYDADGRLVEAVTRRESEFDAGQVRLLLAHLRTEKDRGPHGVPLSLATDPALDPATRKPGGPYVEVSGPTVDYLARELAAKQKAYYDKYPNAPRDGHLWGVRRVDPPSVAAE